MIAAARTGPTALLGLMAAATLALTALAIGPQLPALTASGGFDIAHMVLIHSTLPRVAMALLAGGALALAGVILQQALANPLASDTTLGFSAGAKLAIALATLYAPQLFGLGRDVVALIGAAAAAAVIFAIAGKRGLSPIALVLAGLVVSLYCGALAATLVLVNERYLVSLFIWGGGSLAQQDWWTTLSLIPKVGLLAVAALLIARPLALMELGDAGASALGLPAGRMRLAAVAIAIALSAFVTSAVGVISFVGLVAPAIARLAGARRFIDRLIFAPPIGALLLLAADQAVQVTAGAAAAFIPTGAVTALVGSPLLLFLIPRLRMNLSAPADTAGRWIGAIGSGRLTVVGAAIGVVVILAVVLGRLPGGEWALAGPGDLAALWPYRVPRVAAAFAAGAMLAVAGVILQRLTGNEMASPEVLGLNAGATLGVTVSLFLLASPGHGVLIAFATAGAALILAFIYLFARRSSFAPERVILAGIALGALLDALIGALSASGDPRAFQLLRWMGGSTYGTTMATALTTLAAAAVLIGAVLLLRRWLGLMPLGGATASALGVAAPRARLVLFGLAAILSAVAALIAGPLSFIGLMAPHMARALGFRQAVRHTLGAALAGGGLLVLADWTGRMVVHPYEIPAGLASALIGAPFLLVLMRRLAR